MTSFRKTLKPRHANGRAGDPVHAPDGAV
jgi:hypothetical protein